MEGTRLLGVDDMPLCKSLVRRVHHPFSIPLTVQVGVVPQLHRGLADETPRL